MLLQRDIPFSSDLLIDFTQNITKTRPCNILQFFTAVKMIILVDFFFYYFHIFAQNIYCGYTLEPPH